MSERKSKDICCCGHRRSHHTTYTSEGKNRKGSRLVCTKDGCSSWNQCDLPQEASVSKKMKQIKGRVIECPCIGAINRTSPPCGNPRCWHGGYNKEVCKMCNNTGKSFLPERSLDE